MTAFMSVCSSEKQSTSLARKGSGVQIASAPPFFRTLSVTASLSFPVFTEKNFFPIREGVLKVPVIKYGFNNSLF